MRGTYLRRLAPTERAHKLIAVGGPLIALILAASPAGPAGEEESLSAQVEAEVSMDTEICIDCHSMETPGIVYDWRNSRHAKITVGEAIEKPSLGRRVSASDVPDELLGTSVGCAECHMLNPGQHADTFDHMGSEVYVVVSPSDCATCHPEERDQYSQNIMSQAHLNLTENTLYTALVNSVNGVQRFEGSSLRVEAPDDLTQAESCLYCHGTRVERVGTVIREGDLGEMEFPLLSGWPSQGVGRVNPDGSLGSCTACHTRHQFSVETARKPETCSECHKGPDVPAYGVYALSKHGNLYAAHKADWDFESVPWTPGRDFTAPTCAVCHVSLLTTDEGEVVVERTHRMNDRCEWRLLGLPYAHPHPISANTTGIRNRAGLPLPTELTGEPASEFLIDESEMDARRETMQQVCLACHSSGWVEPQFERIHHTIAETNELTLTATKILLRAWEGGLAQGPGQDGSPFDEPIEKMWVEQWLFFANSTRLASAMAGADYGVFANGRWYLSKNIREMEEWLRERTSSLGD